MARLIRYWQRCPRCDPQGRAVLREPGEDVSDHTELFYSMGDGLRCMYLESEYDTPEEFLASLECPDYPEPMQFPRYW